MYAGRTINILNNRLTSFKNYNSAVVGSVSAPLSHVFDQQEHQSLFPTAKNAEMRIESPGRRLFSTKPFTMVETKLEDVHTPKRPTSPHLTIYKLPLPAILSITHRATGIAIGVGLATLTGLAVFGAHDVPFYIQQFKTLYPELIYPTRFFVTFPLVFHTLAGARHLYWDTLLKGINTKSAEVTGMVIVAASVVLSLAVSFIELASA
ncbi:hypothetical protein SAMD00019534_106850 [Acytostelium subglobosum LB1]|uniref:hypothetical protein n=1 Tax=Acytostelium subglobosum LB1 TaxID=1410327 RepID=UPI000644F160|nr:hypothetical protein SAMD00019534_106850 [Acytostelium subglobosum LB1]GAM27509.1 hypothetical protein SAMD00019534_106850 [Acytostelium subglobosum LB1]|eukprot:XP_012749574.1 hypothetical protein SAMD00019534_106850 [Acytostelium subglobosum LB1]